MYDYIPYDNWNYFLSDYTYIYIHIHIYTHTYMYTYMHTYIFDFLSGISNFMKQSLCIMQGKFNIFFK